MPYPAHLDHLVYATPDFDQGLDKIEALLGVRPAIGGVHPSFGTRNALLSLGDSVYLEVLAPDPSLPVPPKGRWTDHAPETGGLMTWVLRTNQIDTLAQSANEAGANLGKVIPGERALPSGELLKWKLTNPYALPMAGTVPFLIDWGASPHPAKSAPNVGTLLSLSFEHPDPATLSSMLGALDVEAKVTAAQHPRIIAQIECAKGSVTLS